jgi:prolactin regulatory element-binding protein
MGTSPNKLIIWSTKLAKDDTTREPIQVIERPVLKKELACTFRAAKYVWLPISSLSNYYLLSKSRVSTDCDTMNRFGRKTTSQNIYTVVNASPAVRSRKAGSGERKAFVSMWDSKKWTLIKTRTVSQRPVTAFDVRLAFQFNHSLPYFVCSSRSLITFCSITDLTATMVHYWLMDRRI